jgi:hypothetical protein
MTKVLIIDNDINKCIAFHDYLMNLNDNIIVDYESCLSELCIDEYNLNDEYDIIICNWHLEELQNYNIGKSDYYY